MVRRSSSVRLGWFSVTMRRPSRSLARRGSARRAGLMVPRAVVGASARWGFEGDQLADGGGQADEEQGWVDGSGGAGGPGGARGFGNRGRWLLRGEGFAGGATGLVVLAGRPRGLVRIRGRVRVRPGRRGRGPRWRGRAAMPSCSSSANMRRWRAVRSAASCGWMGGVAFRLAEFVGYQH